MPLVMTEVHDRAALAALIAAATVLGADLKAGLYTNVIAPTKVLVLTDLTEPTYASYVRQAVVMGPVMRDPVNGIASIAASLHWQETGAVTPVIIQGLFYVSGAGPDLRGIEPFKAPIPLNDLLDAFDTTLEYIQSQEFTGFTTVVQ
jgi:hypothetical protein